MRIVYIMTFLFVVACTTNNSESRIRPASLTCEYLENPSVVDVPHPRLAWINIADRGERGQRQSAYQIRVGSTKEKLSQPDLWDSGKVISDQSNRIEYKGEELKSRQDCWWTVRTWDREGNASDWSNPSYWKMGLLNPNDWNADWIGAPWQGEEALPAPDSRTAPLNNPGPPAPMLRKEFTVTKRVVKAEAFVTGLGYFEFYVNGKKVGDDVLVPNQTNYSKRPGLPDRFLPLADNFKDYKVMYLHYDITDRITQGKNVIGSILGNGFYNPAKAWAEGYGSPRFIGQIHITYNDGTEEVIVSDKSWKASKSPILMDMVYYGEHYDARMEQKDWCRASFDASDWAFVVKRQAPTGRMVAHTAHRDIVMEKIAPVSIKKLDNGNYLVDFGVEISGWIRINNVKAVAGHRVDIKFNSSDFSGDNSYTFRGGEQESYAPRFNWFVFSSIEISNWPGELQASQIMAEAVNTNIKISAEFETSSQLLNDINRIWRRSQLDNMHGGIASDCPHRERSAYTGDAQAACAMVMQNFNARNFYHKWMQDILGAQNPETGYVPNAAPWQPGCGGGVAWGAAIAEIPWEFYLQYGSFDMLQDNYEGIKEYIKYMKQWVDDDGIMYSQRVGSDGEPLEWFNLGDWVAPDSLPSNKLVHTFYFWRCASVASKIAKVLDEKEDANKYERLAEKTKYAFQTHFYNQELETYGNYGQNVFALKMGVPKEQEAKVVSALKGNIEKNDGHLDTGIFGTKFLFEVLSDYGMHELAYDILTKKTYPSFGHWLAQGATTTWEQWNGDNSRNHPMFGGGLVWMYRKLAGMNADPMNPGYKHIIFKPQFIKEVDFVSYSNETPYGKAGISWKKKGEKRELDIIIPVSSTATVYLPIEDVNQLKESGELIDQIKEIQVVSFDSDKIILSMGSGEFHFEF